MLPYTFKKNYSWSWKILERMSFLSFCTYYSLLVRFVFILPEYNHACIHILRLGLHYITLESIWQLHAQFAPLKCSICTDNCTRLLEATSPQSFTHAR